MCCGACAHCDGGMDGARTGRTAQLARNVLERARRRGEREEESERIGAAFSSVMSCMARATRECQVTAGVRGKYYSLLPARSCGENEVKHICRYHGRQAGEEELESSLEPVREGRQALQCTAQGGGGAVYSPPSVSLKTKKASKDIYIEVSPGIYSITATSEDMVKQTHVVDVSAGQSIDLTFVL
uniref:A-kinase interacting protein 1 n=1 Tax=Coturnix japonica TaxID=93934 RepID=A0A8C2SZE4_COTJA